MLIYSWLCRKHRQTFICNVATCTRHSVNQTQTHKHKQPAIMIDKFEVMVMVNIDSSNHTTKTKYLVKLLQSARYFHVHDKKQTRVPTIKESDNIIVTRLWYWQTACYFHVHKFPNTTMQYLDFLTQCVRKFLYILEHL